MARPRAHSDAAVSALSGSCGPLQYDASPSVGARAASRRGSAGIRNNRRNGVAAGGGAGDHHRVGPGGGHDGRTVRLDDDTPDPARHVD